MLEYKVLVLRANRAEEELNRLARDGWRVVSTAVNSGVSLFTSRAPVIFTLARESRM